ncbi:MAG: DUF3106 domain-containing protein [Burkholderiaceae bacterium]|jgi:hypothetical protein|nr:DUF3106 domain-containing protein [Burkholderiaceae bacterium]
MCLACVRRAFMVLTLAVAALGGAGAAWAQALWSELTPQQQVALAPLADQWLELNAEQQRNWMAISRRYPRMTPGERQVLQDRMTEWAALTPSERNQARFNFNAIKSSLSAEQRRAKWEEYRNLPPAEKERLAKKRRMLHGTAPALRPPLPGRLVKPPTPLQAVMPVIEPPIDVYNEPPRHMPRVFIPADHNTLLPRALLDEDRHRR